MELVAEFLYALRIVWSLSSPFSPILLFANSETKGFHGQTFDLGQPWTQSPLVKSGIRHLTLAALGKVMQGF